MINGNTYDTADNLGSRTEIGTEWMLVQLVPQHVKSRSSKGRGMPSVGISMLRADQNKRGVREKKGEWPYQNEQNERIITALDERL